MYPKNSANPPPIYARILNEDGAPIESNVSVYHISTAKSSGAGTLSYISSGIWRYTPTQSETNYGSFAILFEHSDAKDGGVLVPIITCALDLDSGLGSRLITISVKDEENEAIPLAHVRFRQGNQNYIQLTNESGKARFALDDGSWTLTITKSGYSPKIDKIVINNDTSLEYTLSNLALPESEPDTVTAYSYVYDEFGNPKANIAIVCELIKLSGYGRIHLSTKRVVESNGNGLVVFENLVKGARYRFYVEAYSTQDYLITIPDTEDSIYMLPSFVSGKE